MGIPSTSDILGIFDLIKKGATIEAQEKIMELRGIVVALKEDNIQLLEQNQALKEKIKVKDDLSFDGMVYWLGAGEEKDGPYCQPCYDTGNKLVRLHKNGDGWWCYSCTTHFEL